MNFTIPSFRTKLSLANPALLAVYAALTAFFTYSCMYAFRKPFTAATFEGLYVAGLKYKDMLIIAQLLGYTISKFLGIKIVAEMKSRSRGLSILLLVGIAAISLLLFALTPAPYNIVFMFLNGVPLGMVWGIVFSYIEGRRATEFMGSVMAVSFIFSSGLVKRIGRGMMDSFHVTQFWMPFLTAICLAYVVVYRFTGTNSGSR